MFAPVPCAQEFQVFHETLEGDSERFQTRFGVALLDPKDTPGVRMIGVHFDHPVFKL
jgi:hypothetical protein